MREFLLAAVVAFAAGMAGAGTLSLQYSWATGKCVDPFLPDACPYNSFSGPMSFVFDISLNSQDFLYAEDSYGLGVTNPFGASLLSQPTGHLGGYFDNHYEIGLSTTGVSVLGSMMDNEDTLYFASDYVLEDHNGGQFWYQAFGSWTAAYLPGGPDDGGAFSIGPVKLPAEVPLPATLPLLACALGFLGWRRLHFRK